MKQNGDSHDIRKGWGNMEKEKANQVFVPDIMNRRDIISYFKGLIDIGPILDIDWEEEMVQFGKRLGEIGWGKEQINEMIQVACSKSIYLQSLSSTIRNRGNWLDWLATKTRAK